MLTWAMAGPPVARARPVTTSRMAKSTLAMKAPRPRRVCVAACCCFMRSPLAAHHRLRRYLRIQYMNVNILSRIILPGHINGRELPPCGPPVADGGTGGERTYPLAPSLKGRGWIPACAGMTGMGDWDGGWRRPLHTYPDGVRGGGDAPPATLDGPAFRFPAFAGMTEGEAGMTGYAKVSLRGNDGDREAMTGPGFRLSPE